MTNHARIGGILSIVAGGLGLLGGIGYGFLAILIGVIGTGTNFDSYNYSSYDPMIIVAIVFGICAFIDLVVSILAIVGGVFNIKRRTWGLALAGSIGAVLAFFPCGIPALIFTALGKPEFNTLPPAAPHQT